MPPSLTVRNLTITPLELVLVERLDRAAPVPSPLGGLIGGVSSVFWGLVRLPSRVVSTVSNGCGWTAGPQEDKDEDEREGKEKKEKKEKKDENGQQETTHGPASQPLTCDKLAGMHIAPFETRLTDVPAADPATETLRLTIEATFGLPTNPRTSQTYHRDHRDHNQKIRETCRRRYTLEVPASSSRSIELRRAAGDDAKPDDAAHAVDEAERAAFTAVYNARDGHLAILSSAALASWMATVDGAWPLSSLSLPGTHNSPACYLSLPSVRCQAVDVRTQLQNGVRFLDVRVNVPPRSHPGNPGTTPRLALVHSAFPVSLAGPSWFADLHATVCAFLDAHPSETVLMSIKREGTGRGTDADLAHHLLEGYIQPSRRWFTEPRIPTLDDVRGRIVLVRRFRLPVSEDSKEGNNVFGQLHGGAGWGIDGSAWPDNCADDVCASGHMRLQDFYGVNVTATIQRKIDYVHSLLEHAANRQFSALLPAARPASSASSSPPPHHPPMFVNFLSGSNFFNASCWPENIAARVNPAVVEYLCMRHGQVAKDPQDTNNAAVGAGSTGIVVTDWVGLHGDWDLIRCIVAWNARLQLGQ